MVNFLSVKDRVTFSFPNGLFMAYSLVNKLFNSKYIDSLRVHFPGLRHVSLIAGVNLAKNEVIFHQARFC